MQKLKHLAIIMDGNGRWATNKGRPRIWGHLRGAQVVKQVVKLADAKGIETLTLFAFSTENWSRPQEEVNFLMHLLQRHLKRETQSLIDNNIRFKTIGNLGALAPKIQEAIQETKLATSKNTGLELVFAINYGGRQEIKNAFSTALELIQKGELSTESALLNFESFLETQGMRDPDLILRTSGELRISNFLLWQSAYSEFYFSKVLWPDFCEKDLDEAIRVFEGRNRRYGSLLTQGQMSELN